MHNCIYLWSWSATKAQKPDRKSQEVSAVILAELQWTSTEIPYLSLNTCPGSWSYLFVQQQDKWTASPLVLMAGVNVSLCVLWGFQAKVTLCVATTRAGCGRIMWLTCRKATSRLENLFSPLRSLPFPVRFLCVRVFCNLCLYKHPHKYIFPLDRDILYWMRRDICQ